MASMNSPDVFFKLGEGNQIEFYDDGEGEENGDDDEEEEDDEEEVRPYGKLNINFEYIEKENNEKFQDAEGDEAK